MSLNLWARTYHVSHTGVIEAFTTPFTAFEEYGNTLTSQDHDDFLTCLCTAALPCFATAHQKRCILSSQGFLIETCISDLHKHQIHRKHLLLGLAQHEYLLLGLEPKFLLC